MMDYVQNKNVSMINEHKRAISEKKNLKIIHVRIPYHNRICGLFGARSSVEITIKYVGWCTLGYPKRAIFVRSKSQVIWEKKPHQKQGKTFVTSG